MEEIEEVVESISGLGGVESLILTDESGSPMEFPGVEEDDEKAANEVAKLQSDLDEHRNVVKYLRSKLNEVNLLKFIYA